MSFASADRLGFKTMWAILAVAAVTTVLAAPAFAYDETGSGRACTACHGQPDGSVGSAAESARRGPHGGYTTGTQKCQTCHTPHNAGMVNPETIMLMEASSTVMGPTISDTCMTCHDGTGGQGVYGVIQRRDPLATPAMHQVDINGADGATTVPGEPSSPSFRGRNATLSCADCHSVHDQDTVAPFVGDRLRASGDTSSSAPTNRLLRRAPTGSTTPTAEYGTEWCGGCHKVHTAGHRHLADMDDDRYYDNVERVTADGTGMDASPGPLGGSNRGYISTDTAAARAYPICQQCHEDSREPGMVGSAPSAFGPSLDGLSAGNPTFQNFPHESVNDSFTVEDVSSETGPLCDNCHI